MLSAVVVIRCLCVDTIALTVQDLIATQPAKKDDEMMSWEEVTQVRAGFPRRPCSRCMAALAQ